MMGEESFFPRCVERATPKHFNLRDYVTAQASALPYYWPKNDSETTQRLLGGAKIEDGTYILRPSTVPDETNRKFLTLSVKMDFPSSPTKVWHFPVLIDVENSGTEGAPIVTFALTQNYNNPGGPLTSLHDLLQYHSGRPLKSKSLPGPCKVAQGLKYQQNPRLDRSPQLGNYVQVSIRSEEGKQPDSPDSPDILAAEAVIHSMRLSVPAPATLPRPSSPQPPPRRALTTPTPLPRPKPLPPDRVPQPPLPDVPTPVQPQPSPLPKPQLPTAPQQAATLPQPLKTPVPLQPLQPIVQLPQPTTPLPLAAPPPVPPRPRPGYSDSSSQSSGDDVDPMCRCGIPLSVTNLPRRWTVHRSLETDTRHMLYFRDPRGQTAWALPPVIDQECKDHLYLQYGKLNVACFQQYSSEMNYSTTSKLKNYNEYANFRGTN